MAPHQQRHRHEHKYHERTDGQQVGELAQARKQRDGAREHQRRNRGADRRASSGINMCEPRRQHVRPGDVGDVARLAHGAHQQHCGHALERAQRHHILRPRPPDGPKRGGEGRVRVDGGVLLHQAQRERHEAVDDGDHHHGAHEPDGDVACWVLGLLRERGHGVEAQVREVNDGGRREDAAHAERHEGRVVGGVGVRQAGDDDEGDEQHVGGGRDVVHRGHGARGSRGDEARDPDDAHCDWVQQAEPLRQRGGDS